MKFKKTRDHKMICEDFWYDLTDGGYINPENTLVEEKDIEKINDAIRTLQKYHQDLIDADIIYDNDEI